LLPALLMAIRLTSGVRPSRCPYNGQVVRTTGSWVRCHNNSVLRGDRTDISLPCPTTQVRAHQRQSTQNCRPSRLTRFSKPHFIPSHTHTRISFIKIRYSRYGYHNKGGYPTMFSARKTMQFHKTGHWVVFIKTRTKACIKGRN
jgi:hypothetical protein